MGKGVLIGIGVLVAVVTVAVLATQDLGNKKPAASPAPTTQEETPASPGLGGPPAPPTVEGEGKEIVVSGDEYSFSPKAISLVAGETVKITFKNMGKLPHNLVITELGVSTKTIAGGAQDSVTVTASKTGMYTFFCSVSNHRQLGMEGKVEIR